MKEHNNRKKANQYAEYITGQSLRKYLARKVKDYCGENVSIFDGAAGSGQLEQYIKPSEFHAVEIQAEACEALRENYPNATVNNQSFFLYDSGFKADAVVMNPPFSLKFKELPFEDQDAIRELFPWKKSGVVDDVFLLKSLNYCKRFAFHIMFPGPSYRAAEKKMRELIGYRLVELNVIRNAFEDTQIDVMFLVIDKEKTSKELKKEIYDCRSNKQIWEEKSKLNDDWSWALPREEKPKEEINIDEVNNELDEMALNHLENHLRSQLVLINFFDADIDLLSFISKAYDILNQYEIYYNFGVPE
jgi:predicted RNA methylase